jgi:protein-disulfide isomerase
MENLIDSMEEEKISDAETAPEKENLVGKCCPEKDKKIKNLISLVILAGGLFLGSLFVDVIQLVKGGGFSPKKLSQTDVFSFVGKTWVAYTDPIIKVQVISDSTCTACNPDEVVLGLHRMLPTILTEKVDQNTPQGGDLIRKYSIKTLPAFVFSQDIEKTDFWSQAAQAFDKVDSAYVLKTADLGIQPGKYVESLTASADDIQIGNKDSNVKLFLFSDFQCPYCKVFHETILKKVIANYGDKVLIDFKNFPLSIHAQAQNAALAGACANEQEKFSVYADKLFATQTDWGKTTGTQSFKNYARDLKLDTAQFNQCLDSQKYADKIKSDTDYGNSFGISGTPSLFINDQLVNGQATYDDIKKIIDDDLAK